MKVKSILLQKDYEFGEKDLEAVAQDIASSLINAVERSRLDDGRLVDFKASVKLIEQDETTAELLRARRGFDQLDLFTVEYTRKRG